MSNQYNMKKDSPNDVRNLLAMAKKRKDDKVKYQLISSLLAGETVNVTKNPQLYEALNKEKMEFEQILALHPDQVKDTIEYVKLKKKAQGGRWYNKDSDAWWGEKGAIPPCCYYARPASYWGNKKLMNHFLNTFTKFRIAEGRL